MSLLLAVVVIMSLLLDAVIITSLLPAVVITSLLLAAVVITRCGRCLLAAVTSQPCVTDWHHCPVMN